jgi:small conductance mechanosensitive channel
MSSFNDLLKRIYGREIPSYVISSFLTLFYIILGLILTRVSQSVVKKFVNKANKHENENRIKTIENVSNNILSSVIWIVITAFILSSWGISIMPLLAGAGIIGIFIGIGSQSILKDIINSFVIMSSGLVNIGDKVEIKGNVGIIKSFTLNNIILEKTDNNITIIPSGVIEIINKID